MKGSVYTYEQWTEINTIQKITKSFPREIFDRVSDAIENGDDREFKLIGKDTIGEESGNHILEVRIGRSYERDLYILSLSVARGVSPWFLEVPADDGVRRAHKPVSDLTRHVIEMRASFMNYGRLNERKGFVDKGVLINATVLGYKSQLPVPRTVVHLEVGSVKSVKSVQEIFLETLQAYTPHIKP